jgi:O-antigen/teichoic acid export membrane protein
MAFSAKIKTLFRTNESLSLMGNMSVAVFGFLGFMLLARTFSQEKFGEWLLYLVTAGLIEMLRFAITRVSIIRFLSGARADERAQLLGSNWLLGLFLTLLIIIIIVFVKLIFPGWVSESGYYYFFTWYPILAIVNLPYNNALGVLQADQKFKSILTINMTSRGGFFVFILLNYFFFKWGILEVIYAHLAVNLLTSLLSIAKGWDGIKNILHATKKNNAKLFHFGKFTIGTLIGSNLLKSADTILIGLSPFGPAAVAMYSVPLKLTEIMEIPLRSFLATAFPKMSKASINNDKDRVKEVFYTYAGAITLLFIPVIIVCVLFAKFFVLILGGEQYTATMVPIVLFQIFAIYTFFLPIDRFTGVALDSINKPKRNFYKVMLMASLNIAGDLVALYVFKSLIAVAFVTILFTIAGQVIGFRFLNREIPVNYRQIFVYGWRFYLDAWHSHVKPKTARP